MSDLFFFRRKLKKGTLPQIKQGFTIVELLIVIVIIAILAAITIVAYNGVQARAYNSAAVSTAEQTYKLIEGYISTNDAYPPTDGGDTNGTGTSVCVTASGSCINPNGTSISTSTAFVTALKTIGNPPTSTSIGGTKIGIVYNYSSSRMVNGKSQPAILYYGMVGNSINTSCNLPTLSMMGNWDTFQSTGSTNSTLIDTTASGYQATCIVTIPGPSAS